MGNCGVQVQRPVRLVPVQVNRDADNRHLGQDQAGQQQRTGRELQVAAAAEEIQYRFNHRGTRQK